MENLTSYLIIILLVLVVVDICVRIILNEIKRTGTRGFIEGIYSGQQPSGTMTPTVWEIWQLEIEEGKCHRVVKKAPIDLNRRGRFNIGRDTSNDFVIENADRNVSKNHLHIEERKDGCYGVVESDSALKSTYVETKKVENGEFLLEDRVIVWLGRTPICFVKQNYRENFQVDPSVFQQSR